LTKKSEKGTLISLCNRGNNPRNIKSLFWAYAYMSYFKEIAYSGNRSTMTFPIFISNKKLSYRKQIARKLRTQYVSIVTP